MLGQAELDLERVDPLAGYLDQVVGAAAEEMETVGIAQKTVAGVDPPLLANGLRWDAAAALNLNRAAVGGRETLRPSLRYRRLAHAFAIFLVHTERRLLNTLLDTLGLK